MKTKLLLAGLLYLTVLNLKSQCSSTNNANMTVSTTTVIPSNAFGTIKICSTGFAYDTLNTNNVTHYYLEPGAQLYIKKQSTLFINMQATSGFTNTAYNPFNKFVYTEANTSVVSTAGPINSNTCTAVTFPATPSCTATGMKENNLSADLITLYPNPAKNILTISSAGLLPLNAEIMNALGQKVKYFRVETDKTSLDISNLVSGIYYVTIYKTDRSTLVKKLVIE